MLALTVASGVIGSLVNAARAEPLPWKYRSRAQGMDAAVHRLADTTSEPLGSPESASSPVDSTHEISLEDFQRFVSERHGLVLDARSTAFYGEAHVPGAISLPRDRFAEDYPRLQARLDLYKDRVIAVYCSGADCPDSELVADALTKLGFRHLVIYTAGWEEWSRTGLPQETSGGRQ